MDHGRLDATGRSESMPDIMAFMSGDHDRLDEIFEEFRKEGDAGRARSLFRGFADGLRAHIVWEEEILFPPFEEKTGMRDAGPTAVMRMEHQQIQQLLQAIEERIGLPEVNDLARDLLEVLTAHNQKEEGVLYPWLDHSLTEEERALLLRRIEELPSKT
jgi:regulator of cell morphogenesis and NO signaling